MKRSHRSLCAVAALAVALIGAGCRRSPEAQEALHLAAGMKRAEAGDYARAMLEFRNAARQQPKDARPHYQLALCYMEMGDAAGTVVSLQKALQLDPNYVEAQLKLAELLIGSRQENALREAIARIDKVLATHPGHVDASMLRAQAQIGLGEVEAAEQSLAPLPSEGPRRAEVDRVLALAKISRKDFVGAETLLKKDCKRDPNSASAAVALGKLYVITNRPAEAQAQFERALRMHDTDPQALLELGTIHARAGRKDAARAAFEKLATLPQARYKLIYVRYLATSGDPSGALTVLEKLHKEFPRDRMVRSTLVRSYVARNRAPEAQAILDKALQANRFDAEALAERAELSIRNGKLTQAQDDLMALLQSRPESGEAHYMLSQVHHERGALALEKQELHEALRLNPALLPARVQLTQILLSSNAARAALEVINAAPPAQKDTFQAIIQRNWSLLAMGDTAGARQGVNRALAEVQASDLLLQDGLLKLAGGQGDAARASFDRALAESPEDARVLEAYMSSFLITKQEAKATAWLTSYAAAHRSSIPVQEYLGVYLARHNDVAGARAALQPVLAAGGKWKLNATLELARLDAREKKLDSARMLASTVLSADPHNTSALFLMAMIEQASGNHAKAIERYQALVSLDDHNALALNNLAWLLAENAGQTDSALKYAQRARELTPDGAPAIDDTLGRIYYHKGLYRTAIQHFQEGLKKEPNAERSYHLAQAYMKAGQTEQAKRTYDAALRANPQLPPL